MFSRVLVPSSFAVVLAVYSPLVGRSDAAPLRDQSQLTISALDSQLVTRVGQWSDERFRHAAASHLHSTQPGAALELTFEGTGIAVRLGQHNVPAYGSPNLGLLVATLDGRRLPILRPVESPREVVLASGLNSARHRLRIEHQPDGDGSGCRMDGFRTWNEPRGHLRFVVTGETNAFLVDVRAVIRRGLQSVRNTLVRNWLTGQCALTGLPPGNDYSLEIVASGWKPARVDGIQIRSGKTTQLPPLFLRRDDATVTHRFRFPALNRAAICRAGEKFRARFLGFDATIDEISLTRQVGPAVISRQVSFEEDESVAYYYDREVVVRLPDDTPAGLYDLAVKVTGGRRSGVCRSPRSVHVVRHYPTDPVFVTFGHLDTSAQYQAEYLERLAQMIDVLAPDMVLVSNAVNPAYLSGALSGLDMPYVVNFGNHQFPGHEAWYGDPVGRLDIGANLSILNFGHPWHADTSQADSLLAARPDAAIKVVNAFESNAPLGFLNRHRVRMIHDAHGIGKKVMELGTTPTRRIGKVDSASFRVVRFRDNRVVACTYDGHETAAIPFGREEQPPLTVGFASANDGEHAENNATITNRYREPYPDGRIKFVVPRGKYQVAGGRLESTIASDDDRYRVVSVRVDIPENDSIAVSIAPKK